MSFCAHVAHVWQLPVLSHVPPSDVVVLVNVVVVVFVLVNVVVLLVVLFVNVDDVVLVDDVVVTVVSVDPPAPPRCSRCRSRQPPPRRCPRSA